MVRPPKLRHSKSRKEPLTIELGPDEVSRIEEPAAGEDVLPQQSSSDDAAASAESAAWAGPQAEASTEASAEAASEAAEAVTASAEAEAAADASAAADSTAAARDRASDEEADALLGSEWPPQPDTAAAKPAEEEPLPHAFGRDPDTPPPGHKRPEETFRAPPPPPPRRGVGPALAAGIIGGLVTLAGAGALQFAGVLSSPGSTVVAPGNDGSEAIAALKAEIAALKQEVDGVKAGAGAGDTTALSQSVTDLQGSLKGVTATIDQVKGDVAALKNAIAQGAAGDGAAVEALNQKFAELEKSVAALGQADQGVPQETIDAINQKLGAVEATVAAATEAAKAIDGRIGAVEQGAAVAAEALKSSESRLAALEQSVTALAQQVESQAGQPKVALAIAAAALKSAIDRGGPFTAEVETFAAIAPNSPELPALREIAAVGIATRAELTEGMDDAANAMIAAAEPVDSDAGFWGNLLSSAESLVEVRPIGEVEGETVPAKVARMEVALKAGELGKALAEYDTLPEPSKAAAKQFAEKIRARVTAEELVAKALAGALKSA